jgi:AcrR family transcriptional regulator
LARTIDIATHTVRREAFMDAAEQLFRTRGYAETSIQDVLDAVGTSRGAFYHYFRSKGELLEAVVDRMVTVVAGFATPVVDDAGLDAPTKLRTMFRSITGWKLDRPDLMHAMLEAWISDENALMREHYRRRASAILAPLLARIVEQGIREGSFQATSPDATARAMTFVLFGFQDETTQMLLAARRGEVTFDEVWPVLAGYPAVFDHVLGAPAGTFPFVEQDTLREWFV